MAAASVTPMMVGSAMPPEGRLKKSPVVLPAGQEDGRKPAAVVVTRREKKKVSKKNRKKAKMDAVSDVLGSQSRPLVIEESPSAPSSSEES